MKNRFHLGSFCLGASSLSIVLCAVKWDILFVYFALIYALIYLVTEVWEALKKRRAKRMQTHGKPAEFVSASKTRAERSLSPPRHVGADPRKAAAEALLRKVMNEDDERHSPTIDELFEASGAFHSDDPDQT